MQIKREATFISIRDKLIEAGLFEYVKGKKGSPNKYKINTTILKVQTVVKSEVKRVVKSEVKTVVNTADIIRERLDKDNISFLFNKYKDEIAGKSFENKIQKINECRQTEEYMQLSEEEQDSLFKSLMSL